CDAGSGSPSRVSGAIRLPGMTPATYGRGGEGASISWLTVPSPIGRILVAATGRGLCFVEVGSSDEVLVAALTREFPRADIGDAPSASLAPLARAAEAVASATPVPQDIPTDIRGTGCHWRVWRAVTHITRGRSRAS